MDLNESRNFLFPKRIRKKEDKMKWNRNGIEIEIKNVSRDRNDQHKINSSRNVLQLWGMER